MFRRKPIVSSAKAEPIKRALEGSGTGDALTLSSPQFTPGALFDSVVKSVNRRVLLVPVAVNEKERPDQTPLGLVSERVWKDPSTLSPFRASACIA